MGDDIGRLRHMGFQEILDFWQIGDAGHDDEALPAPIAFPQERLAQGDGVELADIGADRQTVDRGRGDDRQVAHASQRQL